MSMCKTIVLPAVGPLPSHSTTPRSPGGRELESVVARQSSAGRDRARFADGAGPVRQLERELDDERRALAGHRRDVEVSAVHDRAFARDEQPEPEAAEVARRRRALERCE